jgi:hypothetical protein
MKIQCSCGTKYAFDVTPEMARAPIRLVCQNCAQDNSEVVNELIRQELGVPNPARPSIAPHVVIAPAPTGVRQSNPTPSIPAVRVAVATPGPVGVSAAHPILPPASTPVVRLHTASAPTVDAGAPAVDAPQPCLKHAGHLTTHRCLVCQKPMCPKCMEIFGFVCSAYCKGKAENQGMDLPVYEGQRDVAQSKQWRRIGRIGAVLSLILLVSMGAWGWYAWVGSVPKVSFSIRFPDRGYSGALQPAPAGQVVSLHGGTLARYDVKMKKAVWSSLLIDKKRIADDARSEFEQTKAAREKAFANGADLSESRMPTLDELVSMKERDATSGLQLHLRGENVWVSFPDKLVAYDWQTGKPTKELPLSDRWSRLVPSEDELLAFSATGVGQETVTRFHLVSGEIRTEEFGGLVAPPGTRTAGKASPAAIGPGSNRPIDQSAVASRVQNLPTPAKLALPAVLAANANQQRLLAEMREESPTPPATLISSAATESPHLIPTKHGLVQLSVRQLESKIIERKAMKEPPKKSALEGTVNASATAAIANEIFNEMQRDRGADVVREDVSRYQVTLKRPGAKDVADWTGEVSGAPELFPLETVDLLAAGKTALIFDKSNRKLWETQLNYNIRSSNQSRPGFANSESPYGAGPCVERGDTLYLFDEGVLTVFDLATGNVRWRLPTVGVTGLFFDEKGMIYVNTTTATPDSVKYSRQIDVTDKTRPLVLKVDSKTGKTLWGAVDEGLVSYISGSLIYTAESHPGQNQDEEDLLNIKTVFDIPAHIRIKRLDAGNGRVLWQHYQKRYPLDVRFEKNCIHLLFQKEMQVLKFIWL